MKNWLDKTKKVTILPGRDINDGALPEQLNLKQRMAFDLLTDQIERVKEKGTDKAPQLLLNISGAAGTGKSFWLNCL